MPGRTAEQIWRGLIRGPLFTRIGNTNPWAGRTTIPSGSTLTSLTTVVVNSDSVFHFGLQTAVASLGLSPIVVKSINPGVSASIGWANNTAIAADVTVHWWIVRTS